MAQEPDSHYAALKTFINYAAAYRPKYISLSREFSAIKLHKEDTFAKVEYMSERVVEILLQKPDISGVFHAGKSAFSEDPLFYVVRN